ncbi:hypothetical protein DVT68_09955 [Dyella solisilvae]|uniref:DUF4340 domain-containing protein n=1 Tax=Dyella solisilvae TaxID=1920168 RepID=A0A370K863_9GAMM|nr:hypothetical protein [Dyella solisilvae]RDI98823.1 hypothetical protein DVT68_09955 [Dyella solisilvae]
MKRSARQRLWLIGAAVALVGAAAWQWRHDSDAAPGALLGTPPSAVTDISLSIGKGPVEHYSRRDGHWWRTDGVAVRADDGRLGELSDTAAAEVLSWRPATDFDPARIGLAPPVAVLSLNGQSLEFGETSVTGPQRYVRVGDRVALVSVRYTPRPATTQATKAP